MMNYSGTNYIIFFLDSANIPPVDIGSTTDSYISGYYLAFRDNLLRICVSLTVFLICVYFTKTDNSDIEVTLVEKSTDPPLEITLVEQPAKDIQANCSQAADSQEGNTFITLLIFQLKFSRSLQRKATCLIVRLFLKHRERCRIHI